MKIIAEIGSNVKSIDDCFKSITMAQKCGADAVKFQYFTHKEMYGYGSDKDCIIDQDWLGQLKVKADACGIEFMCTFFSPQSLMKHQNLIDTVKIASSDMLYLDLLEAAKALKKPVLVSTGGHSLNDCRQVVKIMDKADLTLLYCESAYPARCTDLRKLQLLKSIHSEIGFSDHSLEIYTNPLLVRDLGCKVIEKHVNFTTHNDTPDAPHSLSTTQFKQMCDVIRSKAPDPVLRSVDENEMVTLHNRRLIAIKPIKQGEKFEYGVNFGSFRSVKPDTNGLAPYLWLKVNGKMSNSDLLPGDSIGPREVGV